MNNEFKDKLCCSVLADRMMANGVHSDNEIMVGNGATKTHGPQNLIEIFDFNNYLIRRIQNE